MEITEEDAQEPLTVCSLDLENPTAEAKKGLLMVLCYYLIGHPQKQEQPVLAL
ncbi:hypothetical protein [Niabella ginsengisoli]|uniref:Uncharacterized protein n=1 Tax=Niabella ginsengisoli TaxID=522298 RepID=A0ABS9SQQ2_9BACT|nr:hypothetical protein [Niabella ginsengisoli]MCH5600705.1 hypothetical protein [Niabella ginsengisoli]